jgi:hypothetical protein
MAHTAIHLLSSNVWLGAVVEFTVGRESLNHQNYICRFEYGRGGLSSMPAFRGGGIDDYMASPMDYQPVAMENEPSKLSYPEWSLFRFKA